MNWDALGEIGELVGATAVVLTLGYLARQIVESTALAKTEYHTSSVSTMARFSNWKAASIENARIFGEGMSDFRSLKRAERA